MSHPEPNQLITAEQLFDTGKFEEAFGILNRFKKREGLTLHNRLSCALLRTVFLYQQGQYKEVIRLAEKIYNESLGLEKNFLKVDALNLKARALIYLNRLDESYDTINQGEEELEILSQKGSTDFKKREAEIAIIKGYLYVQKGDINQALEYSEHSLVLREELGITHEIVESLSWISYVLCKYKGELDRALKYTEQNLVLVKQITKKYYIGMSLNCIAAVYTLRGELDRCIVFFEKSLAIFKEINNKRMMAILLNNVGEKYRMKGELDRALNCLEQSFELAKELGNLRDIAVIYDFLIQILIDKGDLERAQKFFHDMEQLDGRLKDKEIHRVFLFVKALLLKTSPRTRNKVKAAEIFNQLLEDKDLTYELTLGALINLCELHLIELHMINDLEVLDDINPLIDQLLYLAEKAHSYWILSETYLLQAKLSLLTFDIKKAQILLTKAQKIAESYGLSQLVMKISHEHDELIRKLKIWENLKMSEAPLSERWNLTGLNNQIENMVKKRIVEVPELTEEEPVFLLIISEGGVPLFSYSFIAEKSLESQIFSGFLTTIDYFIREVFSEGLNRAIFGDYTLIMESTPPFFISYVFKGDSYYALQKINYFIEHIQKKVDLWQRLLTSFQEGKSIHLKDHPFLESLIKELFIKKTINFRN